MRDQGPREAHVLRSLAHAPRLVLDDASVSLVRDRVRNVSKSAGLDDVAEAAIVTAASELVHSQLASARSWQNASRRPFGWARVTP
jgi:hypothetical protein